MRKTERRTFRHLTEENLRVARAEANARSLERFDHSIEIRFSDLAAKERRAPVTVAVAS